MKTSALLLTFAFATVMATLATIAANTADAETQSDRLNTMQIVVENSGQKK